MKTFRFDVFFACEITYAIFQRVGVAYLSWTNGMIQLLFSEKKF